MKLLTIAIAVSAMALLGTSAANAADNSIEAKAATAQATEFSSQHRRHHRYAPGAYYAQPYYAPAPYYYGGGPAIGFGFGGGHFGGHHGGHH